MTTIDEDVRAVWPERSSAVEETDLDRAIRCINGLTAPREEVYHPKTQDRSWDHVDKFIND